MFCVPTVSKVVAQVDDFVIDKALRKISRAFCVFLRESISCHILVRLLTEWHDHPEQEASVSDLHLAIMGQCSCISTPWTL